MDNSLPVRKALRLRNFDYNSPGAYFITFCTHNRENTLSRITVGALHEAPANELTERGRIVDELIQNVPAHLGVRVDAYVIMPNHVHLLLAIEASTECRALHEAPLREEYFADKRKRERSAISKTVGYIKMNASKRIRAHYGDEKIWHRRFHDHVVRNQRDYDMIAEYIQQNPLRWQKDCFYSE